MVLSLWRKYCDLCRLHSQYRRHPHRPSSMLPAPPLLRHLEIRGWRCDQTRWLTLPGDPNLHFALVKHWRTSPNVRLGLSVRQSTITMVPARTKALIARGGKILTAHATRLVQRLLNDMGRHLIPFSPLDQATQR